MLSITDELLIAVALFALLGGAFEVGFRAARRRVADGEKRAVPEIGAIQGAILGLLGLLLAFCFSAASARFLDRQDWISREANAIGTAALRAELLPAPHGARLHDTLRRYTEHRLDAARRIVQGIDPADADEIAGLHAEIWSAALDGVNARPDAMVPVLNSVNEVIDIHAMRVAAGRKHVPWLVMGLLIACSALAMGVTGYGCGVTGKRRAPMTLSLAALIGAALWITLDLDHPRAGLLQLSDAPLRELRFDAPKP
ncbi:MAG: hypothetical protein U0572_17895 [Phycisphaerales bacterium]